MDRSYKASLIVTVIINMSFVERFQNEPWFALANAAVFGSLGYLFLDKILCKNKSSKPSHSTPSEYQNAGFSAISKQVQKKKPVHKIVFSGGPCAGKTTACEEVKKVFEQRGFQVMIVPEAAKLLVESGAMILMDKLTADERIQFQEMVVKMVIHFEDYFVKLAEMSGQPSIVVCDRGTMDVRAYMSKDEFECMLDNEGWTTQYLRDKRYDNVIYMITAADGAEEFYSLANNVARHETAEQAKALDARTLIGWEGHSSITILRNNKGETFEDKITKVIETVESIVGHKEPSKKLEKYLVKDVDFPGEQQIYRRVIDDTFLINENKEDLLEDRIQKIDDHGVYQHYRIFVRKLGTVTNVIPNTIKKLLTPIEYIHLKINKSDPKYSTVVTIETNFVYQKQFFTLKEVLLPTGTVRTLQTTILSKNREDVEASLPPFVQIEKDISKDHTFDLSEYAKVKKQ